MTADSYHGCMAVEAGVKNIGWGCAGVQMERAWWYRPVTGDGARSGPTSDAVAPAVSVPSCGCTASLRVCAQQWRPVTRVWQGHAGAQLEV